MAGHRVSLYDVYRRLYVKKVCNIECHRKGHLHVPKGYRSELTVLQCDCIRFLLDLPLISLLFSLKVFSSYILSGIKMDFFFLRMESLYGTLKDEVHWRIGWLKDILFAGYIVVGCICIVNIPLPPGHNARLFLHVLLQEKVAWRMFEKIRRWYKPGF